MSQAQGRNPFTIGFRKKNNQPNPTHYCLVRMNNLIEEFRLMNLRLTHLNVTLFLDLENSIKIFIE